MSIRTWLGYTHAMFRSQSPDIGYQNITYANGIFMAVGHQKGFPFAAYPTEGAPVTCAGSSYSADGINWTDSRLPFAGTSTNYTGSAYANARWCAVSQMWMSPSVYRNNQIASTDNLATWAANPGGRSVGFLSGVVGGANKFFCYGMDTSVAGAFVVGILQTSTGLGGTWVPEPLVTAGQPAQLFSCACQRGNDDFFLFMTSERTKTFSAGTWTRYTNPAYGNFSGGNATLREPTQVVWVPAGGTVPTGFYALIENTAPSSANRFARDIWTSGPLGGTWAQLATLPASGANNGGWSSLCYNGQILVAVGEGAIASSRNGATWTLGYIPGGAWTSIASDGKDFVCVSADGYRLKISGSSLTAATK